MTEGQRVKLEEYLDDFEVAVTVRTLCDHPNALEVAVKAANDHRERITDHLDTIQGVAHGTVELGPCDCWDCTRRRDKQRVGAR